MGERPPPSDPAQRTLRAAAHCSDYRFPMYDSLSTLAAGTWVLYANQKIDDNGPKPASYIPNQYGGADYVPASSGSPSTVSRYKLLRTGGYGSMVLFGLSAIYGWVIEAKCRSLRQEVALENHPPPEAPPPRSFPSGVLGFGFEFRPAQAEQHCVAQGRSWSFQTNVGWCRAPLSGVEFPDVRLDFELGVPSRITVIYHTSAERLATHYRQLANSVSKIYGPPQAEPPLSASCTDSLAGCLRNHERPAGPVWRWARGTIDLSPRWDSGGATLELRYSRGEAE